jgi:hypothetical protein
MSDDQLDDPKVKEFMDKWFKGGEYAVLSVMVNLKELPAFMEYLQKSNLHLAMIPNVRAGIDFAMMDADTKKVPQ